MSNVRDYRVTVKIRNNRILKAIEDVGGAPGKKWCDANGLWYGSVNNLINMTEGPLQPNGRLRDVAERLCEVLNKIPDDLWSNEQLYPLEKNFSEMEMDHEQIVAMLPSEQQFYLHDDSELQREQQGKILDRVMQSLPKRERDVAMLRFYEDKTLEEVGEIIGVSAGRVGQIEASALRKLRHSERLNKLCVLMEDLR